MKLISVAIIGDSVGGGEHLYVSHAKEQFSYGFWGATVGSRIGDEVGTLQYVLHAKEQFSYGFWGATVGSRIGDEVGTLQCVLHTKEQFSHGF